MKPKLKLHKSKELTDPRLAQVTLILRELLNSFRQPPDVSLCK